MVLADIIQLALVVIAIMGLLVSIWFNSKQFKDLKDQFRLQLFADYTKRYQEIKLRFPTVVYSPDFDIHELESEEKEDLRRAIRAYFDLCSEEFYLEQNNMISSRVWKMWRDEIVDVINRPAFYSMWIEYKEHYDPNEDFERFLNSAIREDAKTRNI